MLPDYITHADLPAIYNGAKAFPLHFIAGEFRDSSFRIDVMWDSGYYF